MADDRVDEIISQFLLNTCQRCQRLDYLGVTAASGCSGLTTVHPPDDDEANDIPLTTGSVAEFYIEPMLSCIGDIDIMFHRNHWLAIPAGTPPPTQLPADFHSYVHVCDIIDSEFPGYVYLMTSYLLTECSDDGNYNAVQGKREYVSVVTAKQADKMHGPALFHKSPLPQLAQQPPIITRVIRRHVAASEMSIDGVPCVRCLSWPPQAADWPTRQRNYGWPDSATVDRVVSNGCDVVRVAHRQCRQHELMNMYQLRLSFSRAEVVLLNSWMPVQQIVYHVLRVLVKSERLLDITDNTGSKMFSNYHIKTLMLWACELKPRRWWTEDLNIVSICVELLHTLAVWLTDARCQHYFISNCNLMDHPDHAYYAQLAASKLTSVTEAWLVEWFINTYVRTCAQLYTDSVYTGSQLQKALSVMVNERLAISYLLSSTFMWFSQFQIAIFVYWDSVTVRSCLLLMKELAKVHRSLPVYFTAVTFLHVACNIKKNRTKRRII